MNKDNVKAKKTKSDTYLYSRCGNCGDADRDDRCPVHPEGTDRW